MAVAIDCHATLARCRAGVKPRWRMQRSRDAALAHAALADATHSCVTMVHPAVGPLNSYDCLVALVVALLI